MTDDFRDLAKAANKNIVQRSQARKDEGALCRKAYENRVAVLKTQVFPVLEQAQAAFKAEGIPCLVEWDNNVDLILKSSDSFPPEHEEPELCFYIGVDDRYQKGCSMLTFWSDGPSIRAQLDLKFESLPLNLQPTTFGPLIVEKAQPLIADSIKKAIESYAQHATAE